MLLRRVFPHALCMRGQETIKDTRENVCAAWYCDACYILKRTLHPKWLLLRLPAVEGDRPICCSIGAFVLLWCMQWDAPSSCEAGSNGVNHWCNSASEDFCMDWEVNADQTSVDIRMRGKTTGTLALGITDTPGRMYPADNFMCWVTSDGTGHIVDSFMDTYLAPSTAGDTQDLTLISFSEVHACGTVYRITACISRSRIDVCTLLRRCLRFGT